MYESFLRKAGVLPIPEFDSESNSIWKMTAIEHIKFAPSKTELKERRRKFKEFSSCETGKSFNGIYVYFNAESECLYVGKGKTIYGRIFSHFKESYVKDFRLQAQDWFKFFNRNAGTLRLYIIEIELELDRQIIEKMLISILEPSFEYYRKEQKLLRKGNPKR